jgi:17beta-estradiol 17-dehydrogenase / very-long-chain 3-oxoacyl-CoA reductase
MAPPFSAVLLAAGAVYLIQLAFSLFRWTNIYLLHQSTLPRYLKTSSPNNRPWALVTGSSDGIGLSTARALLGRGFDVLIHGRNEKKLQGITEQLLKDFPGRQVAFVVADAAEVSGGVSAVVKRVHKLVENGGELKILMNNVGGMGMFDKVYARLDELSEETVQKVIDINALFPIQLTRALLPFLVQSHPALILDISSFTGVVPMPYLSPYSASKASNLAVSACVRNESVLAGRDLEVLGIVVGKVITGPDLRMDPNMKTSFSMITADDMANAILARVGCGEKQVVGHWRHAVSTVGLGFLPSSMQDSMVRKVMAGLKDEEDKRL